MNVENQPNQNREKIKNILPYLQGDPSSSGPSHVKKENKVQSLKISQIVFIGTNYDVKYRCMKANLDLILEHQIKCESMKACKSTQAKHMRGFILLPNLNVIEIQKKSHNPCNTSFLCCTFCLHLNTHSQRTKQQAKQANTRYAIYIQLMQN